MKKDIINLDVRLLIKIMQEIIRRHEVAEQSSDWDINDPLVDQAKQILNDLNSLQETV